MVPKEDGSPGPLTPEDDVEARRNQSRYINRHENTVLSNDTQGLAGRTRQSPVGHIPLTGTQKSILLSCGYPEGELNSMRFHSSQEAYDWCGVQMRSPRKRVRLTNAQKKTLRGCGYSGAELDNMRFSTGRESYEFVGTSIERYFFPMRFYDYDYGLGGGGDDDIGDYELETDGNIEYEDEREESEGEEEAEEWEESLYEEEYEESESEEEEDISEESGEEQSPTDPVHVTREETPRTRAGNNITITQEVKEEEEEEEKVCGQNAVELPNIKTEHALLTCGICFEPMGHDTDRRMAAGECGHVYCLDCITATASRMSPCPSCQRRIHARSIRHVYIP